MANFVQRSLMTAAGAAAAYGAYRILSGYARHIDFAGKVVVVTGALRGLGLVMARQLADEGARLAICARHENQLARAAHELRGRGACVLAVPCDLTKLADVEAFCTAVERQFRPVDVLINNAGVIQVGPLETMTPEDFDQAMAVHFWAPLRMMEQVLPGMRQRGAGRIVNIASIGGRVAVPHLAPYCASKFALVGLSQAYRTELARHGVYVTTVCPGLMRTGSHHHAWFKGQHRREYTWFSLGASAPLLAMGAEQAAKQVLRACRYGRSRVTLSLPAKLASTLDALAPDLTYDAAAVVARLLPAPGGVGERAVEGRRSSSRWSPSIATLLGERAALRNNELSP